MMAPFCQRLRDSGVVTNSGVVTIRMAEYRTLESAPASTLEDMLEDASAALESARKARAGGTKLHVLGASFGGLLALHAVMEDPRDVTGLILLNPVTNTGEGGFSNRVVTPASHAALSPLTRYAGHPLLSRLRCFIAHGDKDDVVPIAASRHFASLWPEGRCQMIEYAGSTHGFFNRPPHDDSVAKQVISFVAHRPPPPADIGDTPPVRLPPGATMLFGIGAQMAGTDRLHEFLRRHPDCHVPDRKEVHYFDLLAGSGLGHLKKRVAALKQSAQALVDDFEPENLDRLRDITRLARQLRIYAARPGNHGPYLDYMLAGHRGQKILCDITPSYATLSAEAFSQMDSLGPARFIFLMRDPVDRMWSQIQTSVRAADRTISDETFREQCRERARELCGGGRMARQPAADYARTIEALESVVARSRIHYVFDQPDIDAPTLDGICAFLGIRPRPAAPVGKPADRRGIPLPADIEAMMSKALRPQYDFVLDRFGAAVPPRWRARTETAPATVRRGRIPSADDTPTIAFLHIPKTAGQTVVSEIRRVVGRKATSPVRTHTEVAENAQMPPGYRFYGGHIDWVDLETLPENRFAFTILRDPRERIASFYSYLRREAEQLTEKELQTPQRTGMRMILSRSAEDYFFGGDHAWQCFIHDHYDNFYCNYLATRKIRGWNEVRHLSRDNLVDRALTGANDLNGLYFLDNLEKLEKDLGTVLGAPVELVGNYKNAGPGARNQKRWNDLVARFDTPESIARLERFVRADELLLQRLREEI